MTKNPKILPLLVIASTFLGGCHAARKKTQSAAAKSAEKEIVIAATNDFHASLERAEGLLNIFDEIRERYGDKLLALDGGDLFQGSLEGNLNKGRSIVKFFNALGLDAAAIGNHELDYGPDVAGRVQVKPWEDGLGNLKARAAEAKFRWLSVNFVYSKNRRSGPKNALGQSTVFQPHAIIQKGDARVCVIGATTPFTTNITNPMFIKGTRFDPLKNAIETEAKMLRSQERCDYVLLTAHAGLSCNAEGRCLEEGDLSEILRLLRELPAGTLDAVVAGHTHLKAQETINGTPVIEAGAYGKFVGLLKLSKAGHEFLPFMNVPAQAENAKMSALMRPYREAASAMKSRPIGSTKAPFTRIYAEENPLCNLIADALRTAGKEAQGAQFSLVNAGGVRADLPGGAVTYGDVFRVLPFDNSLAVVELKGSELKRLLEIAMSGGHGMSCVSGLKLKRAAIAPGQRGNWDRDLNGDHKTEDWERNLLLEIADSQGHALRDDATYKLATLDFLVVGGDHQAVFYDRVPVSRKHFYEGIWIRDIVTEALKKQPNAAPEDYFNPKQRRIELVRP